MAAVPMEHLVAAVRALDPGSRALLDLSVRWRVADAQIAAVLGTHPAEVALRRARVIDRLSGAVAVNGSGELVETALAALPAEAWSAPPRPPEADAPRPLRPAVAQPRPPAPSPPAPPPAQAAPLPAPPPPAPGPQPAGGWAWQPAPPPYPPQAPSRERGRLPGWQAAVGGVLVAGVGAAVGIALGRRLRRR